MYMDRQIVSEPTDGIHGSVLRTPTAVAGNTSVPVSKDVSVSDTSTIKREYSPSLHPTLSPAAESGVYVAGAEAEFAELNRRLSNLSHLSKTLSRTTSRRETLAREDVEKQPAGPLEPEPESWDLEETLRGRRKEEAAGGIKSKRIGVIWDDLAVTGIGGTKNIVKTFPQAFVSFFNLPGKLLRLFGRSGRGRECDILKGFRGVARPGEMVLVLGRPGSGCTTFLKVIANQRFGYSKVSGEVLYGPYDPKTFEKRYRGEAVYNGEDDIHHGTLTVGQTLGFALDVKTPGKRPAGVSRKEFKEQVISLLLKMFNIEHTRNTMVGNQTVRGISGGERKRVSIAEMMVTSSCVCAWDNTTRGLDASTAVDFAKSLRIMTNIYKTTTLVSLYQASESIYRQFDKVMVIDRGRQVYFGPAKEARAYFENLGFHEKPRQATPDYLTGCTDPFERGYKPGRSAANVPSDADSLAIAFQNSTLGYQLVDEMGSYRAELAMEKQTFADFEIANQDAKRKHTSRSSVYGTPFYGQIGALIKRQFLMKWQDKFSLVVSWATTVLVAIILGTVWLDLPKTSAGAFTRGGVLFISYVFTVLEAYGALGSTMLDRPIVNRHRAYGFHRPSALWIAHVLVDTAFASLRILVFSILVYFLCGLVRQAGAFLTFYLVMITGYMAMTLVFRTLGCLSPDYDSATKLATITITLFFSTAGYIIPYQDQQVWLRWSFWVNLLGLGFSAMMMNEFKGLSMTCTSESLVPSGPGYDNLLNQVCTLPGAVPGVAEIAGEDYIGMAFSYDSKDLWRNYGLIIVLIAFFFLLNVSLGEVLRYGAAGKTVTFFAKENTERKRLNDDLKHMRRQERNIKQGTQLNISSKAVLTWENLCYDVPVASGQLRILKDVFGFVRPGALTALMGASGAGKTTLLDVLAARKNIGVVSGDILVDGKTPGTAFQRGTSYAEQLDVHESTQTVREALRFSADLRQPYEVSREEKYAYVEEIILLLEMEDIADAVIGNSVSGLAVEQRKRVTIGVELAAKPQLLLFLDEPTSGLDSQSAFNIIRFLKKLATAGQCILCTIHQPNSTIFENFDRLLLLQRGGETVYFGDIGKEASVLLDYFKKNGAVCPSDANPAEWMLDAIGAGQASKIGSRDWGDIWRSSVELANVKEEIIRIKAERIQEVESNPGEKQMEYATPLWQQIKVVTRRSYLAFWRSPNYGFTRLFVHVVLGLTCLNYLNLNDSRSSLQNRVFIIFQVMVLPAVLLPQVEAKYDLSRLIFYRESAAKAYRQFPFALAMVLAEIPYSIISAVGFFLPLYFLPGFQPSPSRAGYQFLMILLAELFSVTMGQTVSALTPSAFIAVLFNPFIVIVFALFAGITVPKPQIPNFWQWLYQLDPFTRLASGMITTELHNRTVKCLPTELNSFTLPSLNQTCASYMAPFFARGGSGYLVDDNLEDRTQCNYCAYKSGDEFFVNDLSFRYEHRWRDAAIFAAFIGSNLLVLLLASWRLNWNRR